MFKILKLVILTWGILITGWVSHIFASEYYWPAQEYLGCTSSFCEFRNNHFHAGFDLRTGAGMPVHAVADGYVSRVNVSATGYGRALYIKLKDGKTAVYAHLQKYNDAIEKVIKQHQQEYDRYRVDFYLTSKEIPVKKGDLVAYTGSSGAGPAHLHFEIRDRNNSPMNPLTNGFPVGDTNPPRFYAVRLDPLTVDSYSSHHAPLTLTYNNEDHVYTPAETMAIEGSFVVCAQIHDFIDKTTNVMSPYQIKLFCNNELKHHVRYEKFSYDHAYQSDLDYDLAMSWTAGVPFHRLTVEPGNKLSIYEHHDPGRGRIETIDLAPGQHHLKIIASDAAGNSATAMIPFISGSPNFISEARIYQNDRRWHVDFGLPVYLSALNIAVKHLTSSNWQPVTEYVWDRPDQILSFDPVYDSSLPFFVTITGKDNWGFGCQPFTDLVVPEETMVSHLKPEDLVLATTTARNFVEIQVAVNPQIPLKPVVIIKESEGLWHDVVLQLVEPGQYTGRYQLRQDLPGLLQSEAYITAANGYQISDTAWLWASPVNARMAQSVRFDDSDLSIYFPAESVREDFLLTARKAVPPPLNHLQLCSAIYEIDPIFVLLDKKATLQIAVADSANKYDRLAIYQLGGDFWRYRGRTQEGQVLKINIRKFGTYAVLRDTIPPNISSLLPADNRTIDSRKPRFKAWVHDWGSGLHQDDLVMLIDDRKVYAEYDVDENSIFYQPDENMSPGNHTVTLMVKDRVGNQRVRTNKFKLK